MNATSEKTPLENGPLHGGTVDRPSEAQASIWLPLGQTILDEHGQPERVRRGWALYEYDRNHYEAAFWSHNSWNDEGEEGAP